MTWKILLFFFHLVTISQVLSSRDVHGEDNFECFLGAMFNDAVY